jgi:hypothetical protein
MELMLVAAGAVLLPLDALRVEALVLHGEVVAVLTLATGKDDLFARHGISLEVKSVRVRVLSAGRCGDLSCRTVLPTPVGALVK